MSANPAILKKIAEARASGGGNLIQDGKYRLTVLKLLLEQKYNGTCFIAEFLVDTAMAVFDDVKPNAPGTTCSFVVNMDGAGKLSAAGNIKQFILALMGEEEGNVTGSDFQATLGELISDAQPARGMQIDDETFRKFARSGKNSEADSKGRPPMTMSRWTTVRQTAEEITAQRKTLDAGDR